MIRPVAEATRNRNKEIGDISQRLGDTYISVFIKVEHTSKQHLLRSQKLTDRRKMLESCERGSVDFVFEI